jgi:flagellar biosynthesis GTPase FlhF
MNQDDQAANRPPAEAAAVEAARLDAIEKRQDEAEEILIYMEATILSVFDFITTPRMADEFTQRVDETIIRLGKCHAFLRRRDKANHELDLGPKIEEALAQLRQFFVKLTQLRATEEEEQEPSQNASCREVASQKSSQNASCREVASQKSSQNASCREVASQKSSQNASCREVASQESSQNASCREVASQESSQNASCREVASQESSQNSSCREVASQESSQNASCCEVATLQSSLNASCCEVATLQSSLNASC